MRSRHGVAITTGGNRIKHNTGVAVAVLDDGRGVIEGNDLTANRGGPWDIAEDLTANVTRSGNRE